MAKAEKQDHPVEKWIAGYARFGYGAKGVIYGGTGLLALLEASDLIEDVDGMGSMGVLKAIAAQPFGRTIVIVIALSLMGYVVWRFIQALWDPEHSGRGFSDIVRRVGYAGSGMVYASIAYGVVEVLTGEPDKGDRSIEDWAYEIMIRPLGRALVGAVGVLFFGIGCYYFYRAIKAEFRKRFKRDQMSDTAKTWASIVGRVGIAARGVIYVLIGVYAVGAAWQLEPKMIKTTSEALALFDDNPTDEWVLAALGVGFIAYAAHMGFQTAYRSIDPID